MNAEHFEADADRIPGILEVSGTGQPRISGFAIQRAQVVANCTAIRACLLQCLGDQLRCIVRQRGMGVGRGVELLVNAATNARAAGEGSSGVNDIPI